MTDTSSQISPEYELLIRLDEKMSIWLQAFQEHKDSVKADFAEVWKAINALRSSEQAQDVALATQKGEKKGVNWLLGLLISTPGLAALVAHVAGVGK